jgi:Skp family chaperone for outer membrane proteins
MEGKMKSKMMAVIMVMGCLLASSALADEVAVASVDLNRIQSEVGYQRLVFIDASDEVKAEILSLQRKLDKTVIECVKEQDEGKLEILETRIKSINKKLNIIRSAMTSRRIDHKKSLAKFINGRYSKKYALIIDAQMFRNSGQIIFWNASRMTDLTDEIIQMLDKELP